MSFIETPAQLELQEAARETVRTVVAPIAAAVAPGARLTAADFSRMFKALAPLGYLGSTIGREFGGAGLSYVDYGLLLEALAEGPVLLGEVVPPRTINYLGTDAQRRRWLPKLFSGEWVSTAAITEPQAGSDMRGFTCKAVLEGDHYIVDGRKRWIKLGSVSDLMTLMVVDESGGLSRLVLERAESPWAGVDIDTVGLRNVPLSELTFDAVRVPRENILGTAGQGGEQFHRGIESSRAFIGIQAVGIARRALDIAMQYAKDRIAFGRPIAKFQAVQTALADAATRLQAARLLCLNALAILDAGRRAPCDVSMAKLYAVETSIQVCLVAMESMGAWGLAVDAGAERCWRDCSMLTAIDGTANVQRLIIGRELLGVPAFVEERPIMRETLHTALRASSGARARIEVDRILHPRSVAVFGASDSKAKFGGRIIHHLIRHGFEGEIYPINLNRPEVLGRRAYPSIGDVPAPPDVAILAVPPDTLVKSVTAAAAAGVGCCVIISTGFAEAGEEGSGRQRELVDIVGRTGMRIVGPNCMGIIVPHHRMALCSSVVLETDRLRDGAIGLVSQSGALMVSIFDRANDDGIGFRHCVSLGNQSDLEICDFVEFMAAEPGTEAVCLYVEGLLDGARFRRAAAACRTAGKPLLVVKTGRTEAGVRSAQSHTASLAGSFEAFSAICREEGVALAVDPDDMVRAAHFLTRHPGGRGRGIGILSSSGGGAGIASDRLSEAGLEIATLTPATRARLGEILLPPQADNPIDLGGRRLPESVEIAGDATRILLDDPNVACGLAVLTSMPFFAARAKLIGEAVRDSGKPVAVIITPGAAGNGPRDELRKLGVFHFDRFEDGLRVLGLVDAWRRMRDDAMPAAARPQGMRVCTADGLAGGPLTEQEAKRLLAAAGIATARESIATEAAGAARHAADIGFPVVVKAVSRDIVHKSDVGAVRVGLATAEAVRDAVADMQQRLAAAAPHARIDGYSVQAMVRGEAEFLLGARNDPQFGPVVIAGLGGIAVEILHDVAVAPAPVSAARARAMLAGLRCAPLLEGARGRAPLDVDAIVEALVRLSWLAVDLGPRLVDLEVNPLIVGGRGAGAVAVDGRGALA